MQNLPTFRNIAENKNSLPKYPDFNYLFYRQCLRTCRRNTALEFWTLKIFSKKEFCDHIFGSNKIYVRGKFGRNNFFYQHLLESK